MVCELQNVDKLEKVVKDGNYYGAQQMYKSISARFKQFQAFVIIVMRFLIYLHFENCEIGCDYVSNVVFFHCQVIEREEIDVHTCFVADM